MTYPVTTILYVLCEQCRCCLIREGDPHHCYTCHTEIPLDEICGCGDCEDKAKSWKAVMWL